MNKKLYLRGNVYWIQCTYNNQQIRKSLKTTDISEAKRRLKEFVPSEPMSKVSLEYCLEKYQYVSKSIHSKTLYYNLWRFLRKFEAKFGSTTNISSITPQELRDYVYSQNTIGMSNMTRTYLSMFFNWCLNEDIITKNPVVKIRKIKTQQKLPAWLSIEEIERIVTHLENNNIANWILLSAYTGMRISEISRLKPDHIQSGRIVLNQTKSKRTRSIPIHPRIEFICNNLDCLYIESTEKNLTVLVSKMFRKVCDKLNIDKKIHFHSLRHSFASNLVLKGVHLGIIQKLLGHSNISTTMIYSHIADSLLDSAINIL